MRLRGLKDQIFKWGERLIFAALLTFALIRLGPQLAAWSGVGPIEGSQPDYAFVALDGTPISADAMQGKVVVVNLWATWCPPCRIEIPALQRLHEEFEDRSDIVVVGLAGDVEGERVVRPFLEERGVTYVNGLLTADLRAAFGGVQGFPTTLIIGRDGVVRSRVLGFFAPPAMRAAVRRAAAEAFPNFQSDVP